MIPVLPALLPISDLRTSIFDLVPRVLHRDRLPDILPASMANIHDDPAALKALQDDIYREKILRSRTMTPEQRLADALELTNGVFARMHDGVMWQKNFTDAEEGWQEVRRRLSRLCKVHDEGRFVSARPGQP